LVLVVAVRQVAVVTDRVTVEVEVEDIHARPSPHQGHHTATQLVVVVLVVRRATTTPQQVVRVASQVSVQPQVVLRVTERLVVVAQAVQGVRGAMVMSTEQVVQEPLALPLSQEVEVVARVPTTTVATHQVSPQERREQKMEVLVVRERVVSTPVVPTAMPTEAVAQAPHARTQGVLVLVVRYVLRGRMPLSWKK
jgi:hypothetical protein